MATAAINRWRPRVDDRRFFFGLAIAMALVNILGFSVQFAMGRSSLSAPPLVHAHGLVFMGWVLFYVVETGLAAGGVMRWHRRLGWIGTGWAAVMVVLGVTITVVVERADRVPFFFTPAYFLIMNPLSVLVFAALLAWGIALRRRTEWHRRLIACAMAAIMGPGLGRLLPLPLFIPFAGPAVFAGMMLFPIAGALHDKRRHGRVHPAWWAGMLVLVAMQVVVETGARSPLGGALHAAATRRSPGAAIPPYDYPPPPWAKAPPPAA